MLLSLRAAIIPTNPTSNEASLVIEEELTTWYFLVSILTLLVYDALTTMDKEVKYFWRRSMNHVTIVYFANRYIGLFGAISNFFIDIFHASLSMCKFAIWSRSLSYWVTIVLVDYILMMRVIALYSKGKILSICLKSFLAVAALSRLAILIYITWVQDVEIYHLPEDVVICGERKSAITWGIIDWLIPMIYGVVLLLLAIYKAMLYERFSSGFSGSQLVKVLIHDQIIYFLLVVTCCILNIVQFKAHVTNKILAGILSTLGNPSLLCVVGSRMLFNLKEAGDRGFIESGSYSTKSSGTVEYLNLQRL